MSIKELYIIKKVNTNKLELYSEEKESYITYDPSRGDFELYRKPGRFAGPLQLSCSILNEFLQYYFDE